jgi:hypothetical protein
MKIRSHPPTLDSYSNLNCMRNVRKQSFSELKCTQMESHTLLFQTLVLSFSLEDSSSLKSLRPAKPMRSWRRHLFCRYGRKYQHSHLLRYGYISAIEPYKKHQLVTSKDYEMGNSIETSFSTVISAFLDENDSFHQIPFQRSQIGSGVG